MKAMIDDKVRRQNGCCQEMLRKIKMQRYSMGKVVHVRTMKKTYYKKSQVFRDILRSS